MERRRLLHGAGIDLPDRLAEDAGTAPPDDLLDAAVAAWTACRKARGAARVLPGNADLANGRVTGVIWY
jgi:hypothetical protein